MLIGGISGAPAMWYGAYKREAVAAEDQSVLHFDNTILAVKKVFRASLDLAVIYEKWVTLRQTGTLNEYTHEFQRLLDIISRDIRLDRRTTAFQYTAGLREPAKGEVRNRNPLRQPLNMQLKCQVPGNSSNTETQRSANPQCKNDWPCCKKKFFTTSLYLKIT